jgi:hypothetical protein
LELLRAFLPSIQVSHVAIVTVDFLKLRADKVGGVKSLEEGSSKSDSEVFDLGRGAKSFECRPKRLAFDW